MTVFWRKGGRSKGKDNRNRPRIHSDALNYINWTSLVLIQQHIEMRPFILKKWYPSNSRENSHQLPQISLSIYPGVSWQPRIGFTNARACQVSSEVRVISIRNAQEYTLQCKLSVQISLFVVSQHINFLLAISQQFINDAHQLLVGHPLQSPSTATPITGSPLLPK